MLSLFIFFMSFMLSLICVLYIIIGIKDTNMKMMSLAFIFFICFTDIWTISVFYKKDVVLRTITYTYISEEINGEKTNRKVIITKKHLKYYWWSLKNIQQDEIVSVDEFKET